MPIINSRAAGNQGRLKIRKKLARAKRASGLTKQIAGILAHASNAAAAMTKGDESGRRT
jgi:hypothetical protein